MDWWLLTFLLGSVLSLFLPEVPAVFQLFLLLLVAIGFFSHKRSRSLSGFWFGAFWLLLNAHCYHNQLTEPVIDLMQQKQRFSVEGEVLNLLVKPLRKVSDNSATGGSPKKSDARLKFNFLVNKVNQQVLSTPITIRLSWNKADIELAQGNKLQLMVKLKPAHGLANLGTFNYLSWLKAHNIVASGYVVKPKKIKANNIGSDRGNDSEAAIAKEAVTNQTPDNASKTKVSLSKVSRHNHIIEENTSIRQQLFDYYQQLAFSQEEFQKQNALRDVAAAEKVLPILLALAFGERSLLSPEHWRVLQATGTSHLIAISGLHVGLVSGSTFFIVLLLFRHLPLKNSSWQQVNLRYIAIFMSIVVAIIYAYLAGFSLPTQRALVMLTLYWFSRLVAIKLSAKRLILLTVFILLMLSPFSILTASYWLSFYAVAVIFVSLWRFNYWLNTGGASWRFIKGLFIIQIALTLMLMPLTALFFQQISLLSLFANIIAVPWMSVISIPSALLSVLLMPINEQLSQWCMMVSLHSLSWLWHYLELLSKHDYAIIDLSFVQQGVLLSAGFAVFIICFIYPLYFSKRTKQVFSLSGIVIVSLCFIFTKDDNANDEVAYQNDNNSTPWQVVFFDVGQGLSILIKRNDNAILYDTGAAYPSGFNMSDAVILPYLQYSGINKLDKVMLSHSDNDHAGGIHSLIEKITIGEVMSNDKDLIKTPTAVTPCNSSYSFIWQGLVFDVLWPLSGESFENSANKSHLKQGKQKNDDSCVILITDNWGKKLLLTGDISKKVERQLLNLYPQLNVDILQVPHHGSKTSSSIEFLKQLSPDIALVSAGYLNRWKMPVEAVSQRYHKLNIPLVNSAEIGQVIMTFDEHGIDSKNYVEDLRPFWFSH